MTFTSDKSQFAVDDLEGCPVRKHLLRKVIAGGRIKSKATIGMKGTVDPYAVDVAEFALPAGRKLAINVGSSADHPDVVSRSYFCSVRFLFLPEADSDYEVELDTGHRRCVARIFKLVETEPNLVVRVAATEAKFISEESDSQLCANP
jgi:hypothetical protein